MYKQQFGMLRTLTLILRGRSAPFRLPQHSHRWRRENHRYPLSSRCNQAQTSRVVAHCSTHVGVGAFWLWCLRQKSFSDFPNHPSASSIPNVAQELFAHTGCEAIENFSCRLFPGREVSVCRFGCCIICSIDIAPVSMPEQVLVHLV